jgi:hypothetical protein
MLQQQFDFLGLKGQQFGFEIKLFPTLTCHAQTNKGTRFPRTRLDDLVKGCCYRQGLASLRTS